MKQNWKPTLDPTITVKYLAVAQAIACAIKEGELRAGDRLPTYRDLAWDLGLNVSTITQAYREATRRHLIGGEVGRGTFVLASSREAELFALKENATRELIDLSTNIPARHPDDDRAAELLATYLKQEAGSDEIFSYHAPNLLTRAQMAGSKWLAWRGVELPPAAVVPTAGAQQALLACLLVLCEPGATVLVEEFTFPGMKAVARQLRLRLQGIACDEEGVLPSALDTASRSSGARLVVLTPNLQNPTGAVMSATRRTEIAAVVKARKLLVIEDDVYGPLSGQAPLMQEIPEQCLVISSLSKTVGPGLRFGFIAGPERWIAPIRAEVHATHWTMSPVMLGLACHWIEEGRAFARCDWQRAEVSARWNLARSRLKEVRRQTPRNALFSAPHLWLETGIPAEDAMVVLRSGGVEAVPGSFFSTGRQEENRIRICLTAPQSRAVLSLALDKVLECNILK
ncbi:PLP-dependent aminotransferase family protein [Kiloniella laminariae]|uniref:PLP-dependent aminotransferase family protein n=1 Tax=Kiloniella laminariae TaxID=454162 RepID=A0ABT4LS95_9PROT|nr:PLP-dependent aminotransferase family protein [Kiloniella laminariae]MCZ4282807.1 PLP-dependent aminotransferase family protein [Kiloniella laminariae]